MKDSKGRFTSAKRGPRSSVTKEKIRQAALKQHADGRVNLRGKGEFVGLKGKENPSWKGDKVGYGALHVWIHRNWGKAKTKPCSFCKKMHKDRRMHWANLDGKYTRDIEMWTVLCAKCHFRYDIDILGSKMGKRGPDK